MPSPLETARFGRTVERLTVTADSPARLDDVREAILASTAEVLVLRYPAEHVTWYAGLTGLGRTALFADALVYWHLVAGRGRPPEPSPDLGTRPISGAVEVEDLVDAIFSGYANHYAANPLFTAAQATAGYREWALRSAEEGHCLALHDPGTQALLGLATLDEDGPATEILLAGVVPSAQGRGLYGHLLKGVEDRALARGATRVLISTQAHNVRVQRAWSRYGFEPVRTVLTVHLLR
ncbi:GNAT family N-acetyltransferase [Sphaerisporangium rhizosphaerae]|uniref:GNAT family N-acetyltransferase n=1 Tax=Sphaerisporangium rhizosphaerae TaxID=2269375 RepID=A0ABW2NXQ2_9ACTN